MSLILGLPKGSLQDATFNMMRKAGFNLSVGSRSYIPACDDPDLLCRLIRAQEISRYVELGVLDAGITGYDGFSKASTCHFQAHDHAVTWAREQAEQEARQAAAARGARQADVQLRVDKRDAAVASVQMESDPVKPQPTSPVHLETVVQARAIGRIDLAWL